MVLRVDFYVRERDLFGVGFSDNIVFRKQYYVRALLDAEILVCSIPDLTPRAVSGAKCESLWLRKGLSRLRECFAPKHAGTQSEDPLPQQP